MSARCLTCLPGRMLVSDMEGQNSESGQVWEERQTQGLFSDIMGFKYFEKLKCKFII